MKKLNKNIKIIVEKTDTGFSAYSEEYPIFTTGRTVPEILKNAFEATQLCFEDQFEVSHDNLKFEIDFAQFFQYYKVLNSKFLAEKIGMNPTLLSQYVQGHKKPSESQTEKILLGIHQIGQELSEINLIYRSWSTDKKTDISSGAYVHNLDVSAVSKVNYKFKKSLWAYLIINQKMIIETNEARIQVEKYFKK